MTIQVYPEPSSGVNNSFLGSVVITSGSIGSEFVVNGWAGNEYTVNTNLPVGTYTFTPGVIRGRATVGNETFALSTSPYNVYVSTTLSSFKFAVNSAWSFTTQPIVLTSHPAGVVFGNGRFLIAGNTITSPLIISTDGINWASTGVTSPSGPNASAAGSSITFGNGYFFKSGGTNAINYSTDGLTWTSQSMGFVTSAPSPQKIVWATNISSYFAVTGGAYNAISTNLTTWSSRIVAPINNEYNLKYLNGYFIAAGASTQIVISTNGSSWTTRLTGIVGAVSDFAFGNNTWVAVGDNDISISTDLTTWTARNPVGYSSKFYAVEYANGYFVAAGDKGVSDDASIYSSPDGDTWTSRVSFPLATTISISRLTYGNGMWLGVEPGGGTQRVIFSSTVSGRTLGSSGVPYNVVTIEGVPLTYIS